MCGEELLNNINVNFYCGDIMEKKTKILAFGVVLIVAICCMVPAVLAYEPADPALTDENLDDRLRCNQQEISYLLHRRDAILRRFLTDGSYEQRDGVIVAVTCHILVIEDDAGLINVIMPGRWVYLGDILSSQDLLDGTPLGIGDDVILETLKLELDRETHVVTSYLVYAISNQASDASATALLPFNIEGK
jgi:hypothetical protein